MDKLPKIGMRNIKTAIAVFICLLTNVLLILLGNALNYPKLAETWYTPFFAGIAACYSMQQSSKTSFKNACIRGYGTIIGGLYGMLIIVLFEIVSVQYLTGLPDYLTKLLMYVFVALAIILLIYLTVVMHYTSATFITCLTFLSVTVSLRNFMDPVPFALNRIFSTLFGLGVSLLVNMIHLPKRNNSDLLLITGLDGSILNKKKELSGFVKYKLNQMSSAGANITIATTRTPASLVKLFDGIRLNQPMIIMNGAAVYSTSGGFENVKNIDTKCRNALDYYFIKRQVCVFTHVILDDVLHIYHGPLINDGEKVYYRDRKNDFFKNYIRGEAPRDEMVCFYILVDTYENVLAMRDDILALPYSDQITVTIYPFAELSGYYNLKIHSSEASKQNAIEEMKLKNTARYVVAFGAREFDVPMMKLADYSIALENADECVKEVADRIVPSSNPDRLIKEMEKIYHSHHVEKIIH